MGFVVVDSNGKVTENKDLNDVNNLLGGDAQLYSKIKDELSQGKFQGCNIKIEKVDSLNILGVQIQQYLLSCVKTEGSTCQKCELRKATQNSQTNIWTPSQEGFIKDHDFKILIPQDDKQNNAIYYCRCVPQ